MSVTGSILAGVGLAGSIGGAAIASHGANKAASTQAAAADNAAALQKQASDAALAEQKRQFDIGQGNLAPWLSVGKSGLANLGYLMGILPKSFNPGRGVPSAGTPMPGGLGQPGNPNNPGPPGLQGANFMRAYPTGAGAPSGLMTPNGPAFLGPPTPGTPTDGAAGGPVGFDTGKGMVNLRGMAASLPPDTPGSDIGGGISGRALMDDAGFGFRGQNFEGGPAFQPFGSGTADGGGGAVDGGSTGAGTNVSDGSTTDLNSLVNPDLGKFGSLMEPWTEQFQAPDNVTEQNDPGYKFRLDQGKQILENSAASRGNLLTGGTAKALGQFGQDYASNEYGDVYNRALGQFQNRYNIFENNQANTFNRLAAMSGVGQTAAQQLNAAGQNFASNSSNILLGSAAAQGQLLQNAGAARATGYQNSGNLYGSAFGGGTNSALNLYLMSQLFGGGGGGVNNMALNGPSVAG